ncbi:DUF6764 family protein [Nocardia sp. NPDC004260]
MKLISAIVCSTAAIGGSLFVPGMAAATDVHCRSEHGTDVTLIDGETACRAATDSYGQARATGIDGVGYANATSGATAIGVGAAGGVGASEGAGGVPVANRRSSVWARRPSRGMPTAATRASPRLLGSGAPMERVTLVDQPG